MPDLVFRPAIYKGGSLKHLFRPVNNMKESHSWETRRSKVPMKQGEDHDGYSKNGVRITMSGVVATQGTTKLFSEMEMYDACRTMRNNLNVGDNSDLFEFFTYYDSIAGQYRKFKDCHCVRFEYQFGESKSKLFSYVCEVIAHDPTFYSSAPGV